MLIAGTGCKSKSDRPSPPPKEAETARDQMHEIVKQRLTTTAGKTRFLELTIDLPESASRAMVGPDVTSWTFKDSKLELQVSEVGGLATERSARPAGSDGTVSVKKEDGAYLLVEHRRSPALGKGDSPSSRLTVEYCRDLDPNEPPSGICCRLFANYADYADDLTAFGEKVCRSMKVTNRKIVAASGSASK
jgi:hypothetical protein